MSGTIPLVMTAAGPQPTPPATINATIIANAQATSPGLTVLPALLVEDMASTATAAAVIADQARVDAINSVTPYGANAFVIAALGQQFGIKQNAATNTSVYLVFSGSVGYGISPGALVSDGVYQYAIQDGGVVESSGSSAPLFAVATQSGSWAVPANTVTSLAFSVPTGYTLTVTNPSAGTPGGPAETVQAYQARVIQAGQAPAIGVPTTLKTNLQAVLGVASRLVAVRQIAGGFEVIVGGGDPYAVAYAIYQSVLNVAGLQVSATTVRNMSVSIYIQPDIYTISFVIPPLQTVTIAATWNTNLINFTAQNAVNQAGAASLQIYINSILVGQPINLLEATAVFQEAVASVLPTNNLTSLVFSVTINGVSVSPTAGTSAILSDPESYFYCAENGATAAQG